MAHVRITEDQANVPAINTLLQAKGGKFANTVICNASYVEICDDEETRSML